VGVIGVQGGVILLAMLSLGYSPDMRMKEQKSFLLTMCEGIFWLSVKASLS
jgi:hypothetical protein